MIFSPFEYLKHYLGGFLILLLGINVGLVIAMLRELLIAYNTAPGENFSSHLPFQISLTSVLLYLTLFFLVYHQASYKLELRLVYEILSLIFLNSIFPFLLYHFNSQSNSFQSDLNKLYSLRYNFSKV